MTDNALLSDANKESDFFLALGTKNSFSLQQHTLGMRLGYRDYSKENSNDLLSWGLFDQLKCFTDKICQAELRGQEYVYGEPMLTDDSFSNYGVLLSMEKNYTVFKRFSLDLSTSYEAKNYYSLNRLDHIVSENAVFGYEMNPTLYFEAVGEVGLAVSSSSEYSSFFLLISGLADYQMNSKWSLSGELGIKQTQFLSRDLTTETQVTRRNGRVITSQDTSKERYSAIFLNFDANYAFSSNMTAGASLQNYQQKSLSGYQDYNETTILAKFLVNY